MAAATVAPPHHYHCRRHHHHLPPPPYHHHHPLLHLPVTSSLPRLCSFLRPPLLFAALPTQSHSLQEYLFEDNDDDEDYDDDEEEEEPVVEENEEEGLEEQGQEEPEAVAGPAPPPLPRSSVPPPRLTVKEKKELASYANGLGDKLKAQLVGKSGVTPSLVGAFAENLESNELLKVKVHRNCPTEFVDAVKQLEESTGSVAVGQIGRTIILYRPSISKMKKKQEQAAKAKRVWKPRQAKSRPPPTFSRARRGQSRRPLSSSGPSGRSRFRSS